MSSRKKAKKTSGQEQNEMKTGTSAINTADPPMNKDNTELETENNGWKASQQAEAALPARESVAAKLWKEGYGCCYYIGTQLIRDFQLAKRNLAHLWEKVRIGVPRMLHRWQARMSRRINKFCDDLLFPYRIIAKETRELWARLGAARQKREGAISSRAAFREYFRATERPFNRIANFFAPIIGIAILAAAISYFNSMTLAVRVDYNGSTLGYISSEQEFYEARNSMLDRLINEEYIPPAETIPTLSIAIVQKEDLLTKEQLADAIMESSGNELTNANGFYLDGQFLGAVENGNEFLLYLDKILSNYRTGEEHEVVQFTKNIQLEDGVYPKSSLISISTLQDYLRSDERLERTYTAMEGDTLTAIAKRYNTTTNDLLRMNSELEDYLTDLRIQYLGYDPDAPVETEEAAIDDEWANDTAFAPEAEEEKQEAEPLPEDLPAEWLQDSKWRADAVAQTEETAAEEPAYDGPMEDPEAEAPALIAIEDVPMQGGEELLVARINVSLGIQVTRRETYVGKVAYGTTYIEDNTKPTEWKSTVSAGVYGTEEILADVTYIDGVEVGETVLSRTRLTDPINQRVKIGTLSVSEWLGATGSNFLWPVDGGRFNGSLGSYRGHTGMDIATPIGTVIRASKSGTVTTAMNYGWNSGYGRTVVINHGGGVITRYAHMSSVIVSVGQYVQQGQVIGYSGNSGNSSGPHCHFEIRIGGVIMAPEKYIGYYSNR